MPKPGTYFKKLDSYSNAFCILHVFGDGSHNLKIFSKDINKNDFSEIELHSRHEVRNLYKFLKEHFENDQKFTHEEYLKYVEDMAENCPWEGIESEDKWRADLIAEFGAEDE